MKIKNIFKILCAVMFFLSGVILHAQDEVKIRLFSHPNWEKISKKKQKDQKKWQEFELFARMYARYAIPEEKVLPLVFNVLQVGNTSKVDENLIMQQIEIINNVFAGKMNNTTGRDYSDVMAGDTKIRFCLGDPGGNVKGINFKNIASSFSTETFTNVVDKKLGLEGAKKDEYINIWITEMPDNMGGIAIMPDQDTLSDGIFIDPDYFGAKPESENYKEGKTIIHLLGQYLGLRPLWSGNDCMDDGIEDTPVHNAPNYRCYPYSHITLCPGNGEEMIGNFMDATPDECAFMFTKGQVARMHAVLSDKGYKKNLLNGNKLCDETNPFEEEVASRSDIKELNFNLVPNPANTKVEFIFENPNTNQDVQIQLFDAAGKRIIDMLIPSIGEMRGKTSIDISKLESNTYIVKLKSGDKVVTKKLIKI
jgi:Secretion system C-terminal sorting domain/Pregnancy-associated plasma protein-A